jgi:SAM-dependent methyltransferase
MRIDYRLESGQIYADVITADWQPLMQHPHSRGHTGSIYLHVDGFVPGMKITIGVQSGDVRGEVTPISIIPEGSVSAAEFKQMRAQGFPFWYAEADLGDGVFIPASIPQESMAGTRRSYAIMLNLLRRVLGARLKGLRGIDVGCSSGYHSLQLARLGASMTGIDPFDHGIAQARFVEECNRARLPACVEFRQESIYTYKPNKPFDFIYCVGVLYHLQDPIGALSRLYDLCTVGGGIGCCVSPTPGDVFRAI